MIPTSIELADTIGAITRCRYIALERTNELIAEATSGGPVDKPKAIESLYGLLTSSLEELKVAEEELRLQSRVIEAQRASVDDRVRHYRQLFEFLPLPALITDIYGKIREVNDAALGLLQRDLRHLEGWPVSIFLADGFREEFHQKLRRALNSDVRDWRLVLKRPRDAPLEVNAIVATVPDIGPTGSGMLYWVLSPIPQPA
jgi:PAS domain S-box-containing protein